MPDKTVVRRRPAEIDCVDVHVGGDVHRIVLGGVRPLPGATVLDQMLYLREHGDGLRKLLLEEPRGGHPSLFADLVVPPCLPGADVGFIIMELMGYPHISGTNTMSTAIALLETGRLPMQDGENILHLEAPGGLIRVVADCRDGKVMSVTYQAQTPSYVAEQGLVAEVPGWGRVPFDLVWTGAFYPVVDLSPYGFTLKNDDEARIVAFSRAFVEAARKVCTPVHPAFGPEGPLSFLTFVLPPVSVGPNAVELRMGNYEYPRNSVCRAPAGVPTTAAAVRLFARGEIRLGDRIRSISNFGTDLRATLLETVDYYGLEGVRAAVTGSGWITMRSRVVVDPSDPLTPDDGLADLLAG